MDNYTLYLDESQYTNELKTPKCTHFCVAGFIIDQNRISELDEKMYLLKKNFWPQKYETIILHESDIRKARSHNGSTKNKDFNILKVNENYRDFYTSLSEIVDKLDLTIIGASIDETEIKKYDESHHTYNYNVAMQCIIENYCQFLKKKKAKGNIVLESREKINDEDIKSKFYYLKAMGTMFVTKSSIQNTITEIEFISKKDNIQGIQLADFIPYFFARKNTGKESLPPKTSFNDTIRKKQWNGDCYQTSRFGVKIIK